jgi:hypothetical protein
MKFEKVKIHPKTEVKQSLEQKDLLKCPYKQFSIVQIFGFFIFCFL